MRIDAAALRLECASLGGLGDALHALDIPQVGLLALCGAYGNELSLCENANEKYPQVCHFLYVSNIKIDAPERFLRLLRI